MSNAVFPSLPGLKWDVIKAPEWLTKVHRSVGAKEQRAAFWSRPIYRWTLSYELLRASAQLELQTLIGFFNARQGMFDSFLYSDPTDNNVTAHGFGVGDGATTAFQLQRSHVGFRTPDGFEGSFAGLTTPRNNLILRSQELDVTWSLQGASIAANTAVAPDGSLTADKVQETATLDIHAAFQVVPVVSNTVYVFSAFLKAAEKTSAVLNLVGKDGLSKTATFDLSAGIVTAVDSAATATITPIGNGWYRCSVSASVRSGASAATGIVYVQSTSSYTGIAGKGIYAWGGQFEIGTTPTAYIPTLGATATASPSYWPAAGDAFEPVFDLLSAPTLFRSDWRGTTQLFPVARTNLLSWSEQIDNASYSLQGVTIAANNTTAPDGAVTADKVNEDATNQPHVVFRAVAGLADNYGYTYSVYAKAAERSWLFLSLSDKGGVQHAAYFNLGTGTIGTQLGGPLATITPVGNGFYRCTVFSNVGSGGTTPSCNTYVSTGDGINSYLGTAGSGIFVWGEQLESGDTATGYIQTVGAPGTVTDYVLGATGVVTFAVAPLLNAALTWTGSYYWRVRFDLDQAEFNNFLTQLWEAKKITFVTAKAA